MRLLGIPAEAVKEAERLDGLHEILRAERAADADGSRAAGEPKEKEGFGCLLALAAFKPVFWLLLFLHQAAPALIPGIAAVTVAWPGSPGPVRAWVGIALLVCVGFSIPFLMVSGVGRIDPFLALRLPSREALFLHRVGRLRTRCLLSGLGWAAALAILLLGADAPVATILPLAFAAGLLPAAIVARIAWAKAPDPGSEAVHAARRIPSGILALLLVPVISVYIGEILEYWNSRSSLRWVALLCLFMYGPANLVGNGGFVLGHLRRSTMPKGAWTRALRGTGSLLVLLAAVLGTGVVAVDPHCAIAALGTAAPFIGAGALLLLGALGVHLLRDGVRTFAAREVLPKSAGSTRKGAAPRDPAAATRPFPRRARSLLVARHPVFQGYPGTGEKVLILVLLGALATLVGFCISEPKPLVLVLAILLLIPWNHLKHRERAWLLGMDLVDQRRHDRRFGVAWQGALLLGLSLLLVPVVGGGAERWALLPWLLGIIFFRMGTAGLEALFRRAGFGSLRARMPLYILLVAVIGAPFGGPSWSLGAAAVGIGIGLLGIRLEEGLLTETVLREEMLRKAEGG